MSPKILHRGFSLIELLFVILLSGIISVVIGKVLIQFYQTFLTTQTTTEVSWQGFIALEKMVNDIHSMRQINGITTAQAAQFAMVDINGNSIQYNLSGTNLVRNGQTVASGVQSLAFTYLTTSGATASASTAEYIGLSLTINQSTLTLPFATLVSIRGVA